LDGWNSVDATAKNPASNRPAHAQTSASDTANEAGMAIFGRVTRLARLAAFYVGPVVKPLRLG
jgi:hypothetical protein